MKRLENAINYRDEKQPLEILARIIQMLELAELNLKARVTHTFNHIKGKCGDTGGTDV